MNQNKPEEEQIVEEKIANVLGNPVIKKYAKGKFLGKGGFARCYEFTNQENKKIFAAKIIPKASLRKARHR